MSKVERIMQIEVENTVKKQRKPEGKGSCDRLLRHAAENKLVRSSGTSSAMQAGTLEGVNHELQVHQIELEMQNEELRKAQLNLEKSRQRYADLYDFSPVGYFTFTPEALIKEVNLTGATFLGTARQKLINKRFRPFIFPSDLDPWDQHFLSVLLEGEKQSCDLTLKRQDGSSFFAGLESIRVGASRGAFEVHTAVTDITERKQAQSALRESENLYRDLVENSQDLICTHDLEGNLLSVNEAPLRVLGYSREFLLQVNPKDLLAPEQQDKFGAYLKEIKEKGLASGVLRIQTATGETRYWEYNNTLRTEGVAVPIVRGMAHDVTERRKAENALRTSEERFRKIFEEAHQVGIVITAPSLVFEKANPAFCRMMGYSADELRYMTFADITHPDHLKQDLENVKKVGRGEVPFYQTEKRYINKSGEVLWGNLIVSSIRDEHGVLQYYLSMVIDITQQKKTMELMREATDKYQDLAESISDVFFALDKNFKYTYWNKASEKLTGIPAEEALAKSLMEIFPENEARKQVKDMYLLTIGTKKPQQLTVSYPGNELLVHEISSYPTKEGVSVFIKDVTDRKKAERQLQDTLENLRKAFGSIIQVMVSAVEIKDPYTAGHQTRSADLARAIAKEMGLSQDKIDGLRMAGSIHDIGKLSIPAEILSKPTKLSELEFSLIKEHPQKGYEILKNIESPWPLAEMVYQHHERMDGSGYPRGLKGDDILIEARILAVADVVEAMASNRPYRPALGVDAALEEIEKNKGTLYDGEAVNACLRLFREKDYQLEGACF